MEPLNTIYIHAINFLFSVLGVIILGTILVKTRHVYKTDFVLLMQVLPLVVEFHFMIYSLVLFIDHLDGIVSYPFYYNLWSLFLFSQTIGTILWLSILAYFEYRRRAK
jgi:hypothetical protein